MGSGVRRACIDVAALLVEVLQRAATSSQCKRGVPCEPPPERASKKIIASTAALAWMKSTSFFLAAEWMSAIWLKGRMSGQRRSPRFPQPVPYSPTPTKARPSNQPARPVRRRWTVRPSAAGKRAAAGLFRLLRPAPHRRRPDCGIGGRRSHAHACRGQPGPTPSAQPPRPLREGTPGSAVSAPPRPPTVAAGHASPGSARGLLSSSDAALNFESEIQGHSSS